MKTLMIVVLMIPLGGCLLTTRDPVGVTQLELDAQTARVQCKQLARTIVQMMRCDGGR